MKANKNRFNLAITLFDELNSKDPNREVINGEDQPKELIYAHRVTTMLKNYVSNPSETLQLAARCQHIQRWKVERRSFPMTKAGYYQWRKNLRELHVQTAEKILREVGYEESVIDRVCSLVKKEKLKTDVESQTLEDVVVLVFMENYLEDFINKHGNYDETKIMDIVVKSLRKMTAKGRQEALAILKSKSGTILSHMLRPISDRE
tara:strand:- start:3557 stop:4171 length:615 start_codon:yes stop_codon:yes gene_type:complete